MLTHYDFDTNVNTTGPATLPPVVDSIVVSYDGGRLSITVNGVPVVDTTDGTRDCQITLDRN